MISSEPIHRSISDTGDLEAVGDEKISVADVFRSLAAHPGQIILRWNWKAALLGAMLRASFYIGVYKASKENWRAALAAAAVEFTFRFLTSGASGALVQSFRRATPVWLATAIVTVSLPIISHSIEYVTHYAQEYYFSGVIPTSTNNARQIAFAVSVLFSVLSAMFNIFIMRHGVLLVGAGEETKSLWSDIKRFPALIVEFLAFLPIGIINHVKKSDFLTAFGILSGFGLTVGTILGVFRGRLVWAWVTALGAWAVLFAFTLFVAFVLACKNRNYLTAVGLALILLAFAGAMGAISGTFYGIWSLLPALAAWAVFFVLASSIACALQNSEQRSRRQIR